MINPISGFEIDIWLYIDEVAPDSFPVSLSLTFTVFFFTLTMVVYRNVQNTHRPTNSSLTLVIKVGTSSICDEKTHYPLLSNLSRIVETILHLKQLGHRVVLVTSAAVGTGLRRLNLPEKPKKLAAAQVQWNGSMAYTLISS
jgi:hypothetical protein